MSTPRFYSWDDDGSPGRALSGNLQNRLKQILVPCLVTGYGSKPGAGWTIGHEHANGFSLINADGNVVNFVSNLPEKAPYPAMNDGAIHIYTAESLTDTSGAIIDGANLCSGSFRKGFPEPSGYARHLLGYANYPTIQELGSLQWTIVSDDKTFVLNCSSGDSSNNGSWQVYYHSFTVYVGKVDLDAPVSGNFIALGGDISGYSTAASMYAYCRGYSAPVDLSSGLAQTVSVGTEPYSASYQLNPTVNATLAPAKINFQQPRLSYGLSFVGRLRGVVYDDVIRLYVWQLHLTALGFSGAVFTDRAKPVLIKGYHYAFARNASGNSFLTDNPAFW